MAAAAEVGVLLPLHPLLEAVVVVAAAAATIFVICINDGLTLIHTGGTGSSSASRPAPSPIE